MTLNFQTKKAKEVFGTVWTNFRNTTKFIQNTLFLMVKM